MFGFTVLVCCTAGCGGNASDNGAVATNPGPLDCAGGPVRPAGQHGFGPIDGDSASLVSAQFFANDEASLLWSEDPRFSNTGDVASLRFARFTQDSAWSAPETVVTTRDNFVAASLATLPGVALVAWAEGSLQAASVHAALRSADGKWIETVPVMVTDGAVESVQVVLDDAGVATILWSDVPRESEYVLYASRLQPGSMTWTARELINTGGSSAHARDVRMQLLDSGNVVLLWSPATEGVGFSTWADVFDAQQGHWLGPQELSTRGNYRPALGTSGSTGLAVWVEHLAGSGFGLQSAWFDGSRWSEQAALGQVPEDPDNASVAVASGGEALVMWNEGGGPDAIRYATYDVDATSWSKPAAVSYTGAKQPLEPHVDWVSCRQAFYGQWSNYGEQAGYAAWFVPKAGISVVRGPLVRGAIDPYGNTLHAGYDESSGQFVAEWLPTP
jgi:hypothetical protein